MKLRYFVLTAVALVAYNVFLIQRDKALFESYNRCFVENCRK
jgi:hypothetical protein